MTPSALRQIHLSRKALLDEHARRGCREPDWLAYALLQLEDVKHDVFGAYAERPIVSNGSLGRRLAGRQPSPSMNHVGVDAVAQRHAGNRVAGQAALLHDLDLESLGIKATLHDFPLESLEMVSMINRWTPSLSLAGSN